MRYTRPLVMMTLSIQLLALVSPSAAASENDPECQIVYQAEGIPAVPPSVGLDLSTAQVVCTSADIGPPGYTAFLDLSFEVGDGETWTEALSGGCSSPSLIGQAEVRCSLPWSYSTPIGPLHRAQLTYGVHGEESQSLTTAPWYADGTRALCDISVFGATHNSIGRDLASASARCNAVNRLRSYEVHLTITAQHFDSTLAAWIDDDSVTCSRSPIMGQALIEVCPYERFAGPADFPRRTEFLLHADGVTLAEYFPPDA